MENMNSTGVNDMGHIGGADQLGAITVKDRVMATMGVCLFMMAMAMLATPEPAVALNNFKANILELCAGVKACDNEPLSGMASASPEKPATRTGEMGDLKVISGNDKDNASAGVAGLAETAEVKFACASMDCSPSGNSGSTPEGTPGFEGGVQDKPLALRHTTSIANAEATQVITAPQVSGLRAPDPSAAATAAAVAPVATPVATQVARLRINSFADAVIENTCAPWSGRAFTFTIARLPMSLPQFSVKTPATSLTAMVRATDEPSEPAATITVFDAPPTDEAIHEYSIKPERGGASIRLAGDTLGQIGKEPRGWSDTRIRISRMPGDLAGVTYLGHMMTNNKRVSFILGYKDEPARCSSAVASK